MLTNTTQLDKELESLGDTDLEGREKITNAQKLLPVHYSTMMNAIGGDVDYNNVDYDRLPPNVSRLAKLLVKEAPQIGEMTNIMTATLAYTRIISLFRPYILDPVVSKKTKIPTNIYAVNIAPSGRAKDLSMNLATEILSNAEKLVHEAREIDAENIAKAKARKLSKEAQEKDGIKPSEIQEDDAGWEQYLKPVLGIEAKGSTPEGLLSELKSIETSGRLGNLFIKISELATELKTNMSIDRLIMVMSELYDTGQVATDIVKTASLKVGAIEGLGPSMLMHTSPTGFTNDTKLVDKLKIILGTYLGRRAFFLITTLNDSTVNIELTDDLEAEATSRIQSLHNNMAEIDAISKHSEEVVKRLLSTPDAERITLSDDAAKLYSMYYTLNNKYRDLSYTSDENFVTPGLLPELAHRSWKTVKLASIWSLVEGESVISTKTMASAIYFTELAGKGLRTILDSIDLLPHERFIKAIENKEIINSIRFDTLLKQAYVARIEKQPITAFLTTVNSALQGKALVQADFDKSILTVQVIQSNTGEYGVSAIRFNATDSKEYRTNKSYKGFKYRKYKLEDLVELLKGDYAYSPFKFKDGRRSNDNIESDTNWVALDIDESELPMDVLHETYLSGTSHIMGTTSDPTNLHKFRLLLPLAQRIGKDKQVYKYVVNRIADELMLTIDPASTVMSQPMFSYSGGTILDNLSECIEPMDISGLLSDAATNVQVVYDNKPLTAAQKKKEQGSYLHDFEDKMAKVINAPMGLGSIMLWQAGKDMQRAGLDHTSIKTLLHKVNSMWGNNAMERSRLDKICNQFK